MRCEIPPGISDRPEQLREVVKAAREAGATGIWTNLLFLRPGTREHFLEHLAQDWPELLPRYRKLYRNRAYLPADETTPVRRRVSALARSWASRTAGSIRPSRPATPSSLHSKSDRPNTILWPCPKPPAPTENPRSLA